MNWWRMAWVALCLGWLGAIIIALVNSRWWLYVACILAILINCLDDERR